MSSTLHVPIPPEKLVADFDRLIKMTHSGTVIVMAARLEQQLLWVLEGNLPQLSTSLHGRLFKGRGPLTSFSSKILLARAMGLISDLDSRRLHAIRDIRNEFAHSDNADLHFDHPSLAKLFECLPKKGRGKVSRSTLFMNVVIECSESLGKALEPVLLVKILKGRLKTSPGK